MTLINRDSFIPTGESLYAGSEEGTVEVTLRNITKRVSARRVAAYNWITAFNMFGKYQTGNTKWPASIRSEIDGREHVSFGRDDRCTKFRKVNNIWFD